MNNNEVFLSKFEEIWLTNFLSSLKNQNRADLTLKNYRLDLLRFFTWTHHNKKPIFYRLNSGDISAYSDYLRNPVFLPAVKKRTRFDQFVIQPFRKFFRKLSRPFRIKSDEFKTGTIKLLDPLVEPLSANSRRRHLSSLGRFFQFICDTDSQDQRIHRVQISPLKKTLHNIRVKEIDINHTVLLKPDDFLRLSESSRNLKDLAIIKLLFYGGLRLAELCSLKSSSFDWEEKTIYLHRKGGKTQTLRPIKADSLFRTVNLYLKKEQSKRGTEADENLYDFRLFPASHRAMSAYITRLFERSDLGHKGLTPHSFRKGCASLLYQKTKDLLFVRDFLNHSDAKVTQTYIDHEVDYGELLQ